MEDFPQSIASQLIDKHVRQHRQLKLSDQSDVVIDLTTRKNTLFSSVVVF